MDMEEIILDNIGILEWVDIFVKEALEVQKDEGKKLTY